MRLRQFILGLAVGLLCAQSAWGILIELKGVKTRVGGFVDKEDAKKLWIRRTVEGKEITTEYEHANFTIIHRIKPERLGKLAKENPMAYRDYAEELAGQKADPEAKEMALRLYAIAAYLDPQQLGRSCLLKMSELASTSAEARKYRAMAYVLDPKGDAAVLKPDFAKPVQLTGPELKAQANALRDFQQALRYYRIGQLSDAKDFANREGVDKYFGMAPGLTDKRTFVQTCNDAICSTCRLKKQVQCATCNGKGKSVNMFGFLEACATCSAKGVVKCTACEGTGVNQTFPEDQLRIMIRAELWAVEQLSGTGANTKKKAGDTSWSSILQAQQVSPAPVMSLESITEFDPRLCVFRKGRWVAP